MLNKYFILAVISIAAAANEEENSKTIQETYARLQLTERIRIEDIQQHLLKWKEELIMSPERIDNLIGAKIMREAVIIIKTIEKLLGKAPTTQKNEGPKQANHHEREKRNALGDFLHYVGGVATEEMLQKQLRIDNEIREKITSTLSRQVTFEKIISNYYENLTKEEESIHRRIDNLHTLRAKDRAIASRMTTLRRVALDDIEDLEDILEAIWTGEVNPRHSAKVAERAGLESMAHLTVQEMDMEEQNTLTLKYSARLYKISPAKITNHQNYQKITTPQNQYYVHTGHDEKNPITEKDTVALNGDEQKDEAIIVHLMDNIYMTVRQGEITCENKKLNLTKNTRITVSNKEKCYNKIMMIDQGRVNTKEYNILASPNNILNIMNVRNNIEEKELRMESYHSKQKLRTGERIKIQHEMEMAQKDLENFKKDTKIDMTTNYIRDGAAWGTISIIIIAILSIFICIIWRFSSSKTANNMILLPTMKQMEDEQKDDDDD